MEDPTSGETESENDKETDDDNPYHERVVTGSLSSFERNAAREWDLIHDDPCHNLKSPPPKLS